MKLVFGLIFTLLFAGALPLQDATAQSTSRIVGIAAFTDDDGFLSTVDIQFSILFTNRGSVNVDKDMFTVTVDGVGITPQDAFVFSRELSLDFWKMGVDPESEIHIIYDADIGDLEDRNGEKIPSFHWWSPSGTDAWQELVLSNFNESITITDSIVVTGGTIAPRIPESVGITDTLKVHQRGPLPFDPNRAKILNVQLDEDEIRISFLRSLTTPFNFEDIVILFDGKPVEIKSFKNSGGNTVITLFLDQTRTDEFVTIGYDEANRTILDNNGKPISSFSFKSDPDVDVFQMIDILENPHPFDSVRITDSLSVIGGEINPRFTLHTTITDSIQTLKSSTEVTEIDYAFHFFSILTVDFDNIDIVDSFKDKTGFSIFADGTPVEIVDLDTDNISGITMELGSRLFTNNEVHLIYDSTLGGLTAQNGAKIPSFHWWSPSGTDEWKEYNELDDIRDSATITDSISVVKNDDRLRDSATITDSISVKASYTKNAFNPTTITDSIRTEGGPDWIRPLDVYFVGNNGFGIEMVENPVNRVRDGFMITVDNVPLPLNAWGIFALQFPDTGVRLTANNENFKKSYVTVSYDASIGDIDISDGRQLQSFSFASDPDNNQFYPAKPTEKKKFTADSATITDDISVQIKGELPFDPDRAKVTSITVGGDDVVRIRFDREMRNTNLLDDFKDIKILVEGKSSEITSAKLLGTKVTYDLETNPPRNNKPIVIFYEGINKSILDSTGKPASSFRWGTTLPQSQLFESFQPVKQSAESAKITDSIKVTRPNPAILNDSLGITDSITIAKRSAVTLTDTVGVAENFERLQVHEIKLNESVGVTDSISAISENPIFLSDNVGIVENTSTTKGGFAVNISDSVGVAETFLTVPPYFHNLSPSGDILETPDEMTWTSFQTEGTVEIFIREKGVTNWNKNNIILKESLPFTVTSYTLTDEVKNTIGGKEIEWKLRYPQIGGSTDVKDEFKVLFPTKFATLADSVGISENFAANSALAKSISISDSVGIADNLGITPILAKPISISDSVGISDKFVTDSAFKSVQISDAVGVAENFGETKDKLKLKIKNMNIQGNIISIIFNQHMKKWQSSGFDGLTITFNETPVGIVRIVDPSDNRQNIILDKGRSKQQVVITYDGSTDNFVSNNDQSLASFSWETLGPDDFMKKSGTKIVSLDDSLVISDNIPATKDSPITVSLTESIGISENFATDSAFTKSVTLADTVGIADNLGITPILAKSISISDSVGISENFAANSALAKSISISDSVGISENFAANSALAKSISISDSVGISENFAANSALAKSISISDSVGISENFAANSALAKSVTLADTVGISENFGAISALEQSASINDNVGISDNITATKGTLIPTVENMEIKGNLLVMTFDKHMAKVDPSDITVTFDGIPVSIDRSDRSDKNTFVLSLAKIRSGEVVRVFYDDSSNSIEAKNGHNPEPFTWRTTGAGILMESFNAINLPLTDSLGVSDNTSTAKRSAVTLDDTVGISDNTSSHTTTTKSVSIEDDVKIRDMIRDDIEIIKVERDTNFLTITFNQPLLTIDPNSAIIDTSGLELWVDGQKLTITSGYFDDVDNELSFNFSFGNTGFSNLLHHHVLLTYDSSRGTLASYHDTVESFAYAEGGNNVRKLSIRVSHDVSVADAVGVSENFAANSALGKSVTLADSVGISENFGKSLAFEIKLNDSVGLTENFASDSGFGKYVKLGDALGIADNISSNPELAKSVTLADAVGVTDSISTISENSIFLSDNVGAAENFETFQGIRFVATLNDSVGVAETIQNDKTTPTQPFQPQTRSGGGGGTPSIPPTLESFLIDGVEFADVEYDTQFFETGKTISINVTLREIGNSPNDYTIKYFELNFDDDRNGFEWDNQNEELIIDHESLTVHDFEIATQEDDGFHYWTISATVSFSDSYEKEQMLHIYTWDMRGSALQEEYHNLIFIMDPEPTEPIVDPEPTEVEPQTSNVVEYEFPSWVDNIKNFYDQDLISETEYQNAIGWLVENRVFYTP